ncbi:hypothetical protein B0H63DRAFT_514267 [Podospora didyma]|uniref:Uncharacterized protein n=1 Tax=Podospora didyma TaxID=330526 RepID=A0AAE0K4P1_9PEZI|nr:hypothetical protein B0H63DRAFT_514267 [Podospora didyma]
MKFLSSHHVLVSLAVQMALNVPGVFSAKPVHQLKISIDDIKLQLSYILGNLWVQTDQSNNPSHLQTISSTYTACVPATAAHKNACRLQCRKDFAGDPTLLKMCINGCNALQDCSQRCGAHPTANFVRFGDTMKLLLTKKCTNPASSCPPCTVGQQTPLVDDQDLSYLLPVPLFRKGIGIGNVVCDLTRFAINLNNTSGSTQYNDHLTAELTNQQGLHLNIKATADDPTLTCRGALGNFPATLRNPNFDIYLLPSWNPATHRIAWAVSAAFHAHVNYRFELTNNLDAELANKVNDMLNGYINRNKAQIERSMTAWLLNRIQARFGEEVDDFTGISVSASSGMVISYTPVCVNGACSCDKSCNGAHICEPDYWDNPAGRLTCSGAGQVCLSPGGTCCTPNCGGGNCGSDGCGRSCGTCPFGQLCGANHRCQACDPGPCNHICSQTKCGTWCGMCKPGLVCDEGGCEDSRLPRLPRLGRGLGAGRMF